MMRSQRPSAAESRLRPALCGLVLLWLCGWASSEASAASAEEIRALVQQLGAKEWKARHAAQEKLAEVGEPALPFLLGALKNENASIRAGAAAVLGRLRRLAAISGLIAALKDDELLVRRNAVEALGALTSRAAVPHLSELLKDENVTIRHDAVLALGQIRHGTAAAAIATALADSDPIVRAAAAFALSFYKELSVVPKLIEALADDEYRVRRNSVMALRRITGARLGFDPDASKEDRLNKQNEWKVWWLLKKPAE